RAAGGLSLRRGRVPAVGRAGPGVAKGQRPSRLARSFASASSRSFSPSSTVRRIIRNSHGVLGEAPSGGGGGGGASSLRPAGRPQRSHGQESGISAVVAKTGRLSCPAEHQ